MMKKRAEKKIWFGQGARPEELELRTLLSAVAIVADDQVGHKKKSHVHAAALPTTSSDSGLNDKAFATFDMTNKQEVTAFVQSAAAKVPKAAKVKAPKVGGNLSGFRATASSVTTGQVLSEQEVIRIKVEAGKKPANLFSAQFNVGNKIQKVELKFNEQSLGVIELNGRGAIVAIGDFNVSSIPKNGVGNLSLYATPTPDAQGEETFVTAMSVSARRKAVGKKAVPLVASVTGSGATSRFAVGSKPVVTPGDFTVGANPTFFESSSGMVPVVLTKAPTTSVTVNVSSARTDIVTVANPTLTFTSANWNIPQMVNLIGVDNNVDEADRTVNIIFTVSGSSAPEFLTAGTKVVVATILDDDNPVVINRTINITGEGPMNQGDTKTLTVNLSSAATTDTVVNLTATSGLTIVGNSSVIIPAGMTSANFTVQATNTGNTNPITAIVTANSVYGSDTAQITVNGAAVVNRTLSITGARPISQGENLQLTVNLSAPVSTPTDVNVASLLPGTVEIVGSSVVTIPAGSTSATFTVRGVPTGNSNDASATITGNSVYGNASTWLTVKGIPVVIGAEYDNSIVNVILAAGIDPSLNLKMGPIHYTQQGGHIDPNFFAFAGDFDGDGNVGGTRNEYVDAATIATGPSGDAVVNAPGIVIGAGGFWFQIRSRQPDANNIVMIPDSVDFTDNQGRHYRTTITQQAGSGGRYFTFTVTGLV